MTVLENKIRRIKSIVSSIENAQSDLLGSLFTTVAAVSEGLIADSELLILQINAEENEFLFV
ncbi:MULTISPECIES: hypothetical protein [Flavobacterium]|uniref:hypothetical protein n=1 Tax=Flavobacterium TaxID=237 RepID=UPI001FCA6518|nr:MULTISPECIES: hypothetical protein [Flavobacterium]UOK43569.1 hypothetical protein LZF87_05460 [Flavobacterium enshiense]